MESNWVDFKAIKAAVTIGQVIDHYGIKLKRTGRELRGRCPIHQGDGTESFHANTEKNAFHCFSCQAKGNVLDLVAAMEKCNVREAARRIQSWFQITDSRPSSPAPQKPTGSEPARKARGEGDEPNKPLGFRLKDIDHSHPYLAERGIDAETAEYFGVGFFSGKGSMSGRIVIPIENEAGELVAYAGRSIDGSEPKYKLPPGFKKSQVLYNLPRAVEDGSNRTVVLVEGFFDCMKVVQAEHACVALMGCSLSEAQQALVVRHFRQVVIMLDGDEPGQKAATEIASRLAHDLWVRVVEVPDGEQPDQISAEELRRLLHSV